MDFPSPSMLGSFYSGFKYRKKVKVIQPWLTLCYYMDHTVEFNGILQARILEWVAVLSFRGFSQPRDWTQVSHIEGGFFTSWATREALKYGSSDQILHPLILSNQTEDFVFSLKIFINEKCTVLTRIHQRNKTNGSICLFIYLSIFELVHMIMGAKSPWSAICKVETQISQWYNSSVSTKSWESGVPVV